MDKCLETVYSKAYHSITFTGRQPVMPFSPKTLDFLWENRMRNSRDWFEEHKSEYRSYVVEPLCELVEALTPTMLQIDSLFTVDPRVDKTISRIWRDTRYSHDKSLSRYHVDYI